MGKPEGKNHLEDQRVDGRMGSVWILGRLARERRLDPVGSGQGPVVGSCEYGDKPSGSGATELASPRLVTESRFAGGGERDVSRYTGDSSRQGIFAVYCYLSSETIDSKYRQPELCVLCFVHILQYGVWCV
jgi:hypothetical protein